MKHDVRFAVRQWARRVVGLQGQAGRANTWDGYTRDALQLADIIDCSLDDLKAAQQHPDRVHADVASQRANWYLPPFDNPYYGGIMTILRFADHMQARGVRQRFLICGHADAPKIASMIAAAFPALAAAEVVALDSAEKLQNIPEADFSFATLWTTAYVLLSVRNTGLKFYFMQDYEPLFYPAGSTYAQAELTYRFGFIGLANTRSIAEIYRQDFGGRAHALSPCVDPAVFHAASAPPPQGARRLFYYARPGTPRNGFELAAAALRRVKARMGAGVRILCAGANWSPADYALDGVVETLGLLPYEQTGELYRSCHAGFVMMMTRHPSYLPLELMACGALVVSNLNPANTWFLKDGENCLLAPPSATCLAQTLERALVDWDALAPVRSAGTTLVQSSYGDWTRELSAAFDFVQAQARAT